LTIVNVHLGSCLSIYPFFGFIAEHCMAMFVGLHAAAHRSLALAAASTDRSNTVPRQLWLCLIAFPVLGSTAVAFAQNLESGGAQEKLNLSQQQKQAIEQGLANEPAQSSADAQQGQVGSKVPRSVTTHPMPPNVTQQVPATKNHLLSSCQIACSSSLPTTR
jgi:hypothetical protein